MQAPASRFVALGIAPVPARHGRGGYAPIPAVDRRARFLPIGPRLTDVRGLALEQVFDTVGPVPCGWKTRGRRCGQPPVTVRDLGPAYGKLRMQPVCKMHATYADHSDRLSRTLPDAAGDNQPVVPDDAPPE